MYTKQILFLGTLALALTVFIVFSEKYMERQAEQAAANAVFNKRFTVIYTGVVYEKVLELMAADDDVNVANAVLDAFDVATEQLPDVKTGVSVYSDSLISLIYTHADNPEARQMMLKMLAETKSSLE